MEKYFKSVKRLRAADKKNSEAGVRRAPTRHTSQSLVKQDEGNREGLMDTLLWVEDGEDGRRVTYWRPNSLYSQRGEEQEYVPAQQVVMAVPQAATRDAKGGWSLQPITLKEHRHTSLQVLVPGYPLEGLLFSTLQHTHEEQETLQLDFPTAIDYLRNFYETSIHLLEVVQDETHATTRFLVGSRLDPRIPHLPYYSPRVPGGPWFRDINGNHSFFQTVRSYRNSRRLTHDLEFFFSVSSEQRNHLGELCSVRSSRDE